MFLLVLFFVAPAAAAAARGGGGGGGGVRVEGVAIAAARERVPRELLYYTAGSGGGRVVGGFCSIGFYCRVDLQRGGVSDHDVYWFTIL
jgi:hypothetical protein